ncbi:MAG TPA: radical SAM/SPASM domain-containing protein [Allosphingosinicella sp.]
MALPRPVLSALRFLNSRLLDLSYRLDLPWALGGPESLMVEPSGACNLRCPLCPTGLKLTKRDGYTLSPEDFERALGRFRHTLRTITFWNYGEPFLNKDLARIVAFAARHGIRTRISTNGHFLERPMLDELLAAGLTQLIVSVDTPHEDLYSRYRVRGDFDRVVRGFRHAAERKRALGAETEIIAQYMLMKGSEDVDAIAAHGEAMGADKVVVKTLGIGSSVPQPSDRDWALMPEEDAFNRYESRKDVRAKINWEDSRCSYIWRRMVLNSDGQCVPCCRDQMAAFKLGSVREGGTLASVWNGPGYRRYRRHIRATQKKEVMCQRCPELVHQEMDPGFVFTAKGGAPAPPAPALAAAE